MSIMHRYAEVCPVYRADERQNFGGTLVYGSQVTNLGMENDYMLISYLRTSRESFRFIFIDLSVLFGSL